MKNKKIVRTAFLLSQKIVTMILLIIATFAVDKVHTQGMDEVPTKKAERPKMDPKPEMPKITQKVYLDVGMHTLSYKVFRRPPLHNTPHLILASNRF